MEDVKDRGKISDGWHTFDELYDHRNTLFIKLCKQFKEKVWRSKLHSNGTMHEGVFILGMGKEKGKQITYHISLSKWAETDFAETLDKAPDYDGHTNKDVLKRLEKI